MSGLDTYRINEWASQCTRASLSQLIKRGVSKELDNADRHGCTPEANGINSRFIGYIAVRQRDPSFAHRFASVASTVPPELR